MRGKMRLLAQGEDANARGYIPYWPIGKPIVGLGIGVVLPSEDQRFAVGDHVYSHDFLHQHFVIFPPNSTLQAVKKEQGLPLHGYLNELGLVGRTAYVGYKALVKAKKGETIYVLAGAGGVGSIVCQLAKLDGLKVIASAGSDEKVQYLRDTLGVDAVFNYQSETVASALQKYGPIDIYWDNVGGNSFEAALGNMRPFGRVVVAGWISGYNNEASYGVKNMHYVLYKSISVVGFNVFVLEEDQGDFGIDEVVPKLIRERKVAGQGRR
ncbi:hypothetical protein FRC03_012171 [Tulasnella sp. 419]|nr:hypothetical protein FRC03_012171 [Tulasnella sp. 419]